MSRHRVMAILVIDDETFEQHDGENYAPPNDIDDWDYSDIDNGFAAGVISHIEFEEYVGRVRES